MKKTPHMIISVDAAKVFDKVQYPFRIKTLNKIDIEVSFINNKRSK